MSRPTNKTKESVYPEGLLRKDVVFILDLLFEPVNVRRRLLRDPEYVRKWDKVCQRLGSLSPKSQAQVLRQVQGYQWLLEDLGIQPAAAARKS